MKQVITVFLASLVLVQPLTKAWVFLSFKLNQERIAKTLCMQRDIPNNACHGECELMKRLKKVDDSEPQPAPSELKIKSEILFCHQPTHLQQHVVFSHGKEPLNTFYQQPIPITSIEDIFHPPKAQRFLFA